MEKIVVIKKTGTDLPINLDISRIVAISDIIDDSYYIYFENAVWRVQADSYKEVYKIWSEYVQH